MEPKHVPETDSKIPEIKSIKIQHAAAADEAKFSNAKPVSAQQPAHPTVPVKPAPSQLSNASMPVKPVQPLVAPWVVPWIALWKNGFRFEFALKLWSRRAAQKSLNIFTSY